MRLPEFIESNRVQIRTIALRRGTRNVRLSGSIARGQAGPESDIDFLVEAGIETTSWFPAGMIVELQDLLKRGVEVVTEAALHPLLREKGFAGSRSDMNSDRVYLAHILECINRIRNEASEGPQALLESSTLQDAIVRKLQILAES